VARSIGIALAELVNSFYDDGLDDLEYVIVKTQLEISRRNPKNQKRKRKGGSTSAKSPLVVKTEDLRIFD